MKSKTGFLFPDSLTEAGLIKRALYQSTVLEICFNSNARHLHEASELLNISDIFFKNTSPRDIGSTTMKNKEQQNSECEFLMDAQRDSFLKQKEQKTCSKNDILDAQFFHVVVNGSQVSVKS